MSLLRRASHCALFLELRQLHDVMSGRDPQAKMHYPRSSKNIIQPGGRIFQVKLLTQTVIFAQLNSPVWLKPGYSLYGAAGLLLDMEQKIIVIPRCVDDSCMLPERSRLLFPPHLSRIMVAELRNVIWITKHCLDECRAIVGRSVNSSIGRFLSLVSFDPGRITPSAYGGNRYKTYFNTS
jgi:hypothetical protein